MQVKVTAAPRPEVPGVWTPGRLWRSEAPTVVEVLDQEDDPEAPDGWQAHPTAIGLRTLARLQREPLLKVEPVDGELNAGVSDVQALNGEIDSLRAEIDALRLENADLKAQLEMATAPAKPEKKKSEK